MDFQNIHTSSSSNPLEYFSENTLVAGRYRLLSLIAQGGFGAVFKAHDDEQGRYVAIKILFCPHLDKTEHIEVSKRFEREARLVKQIKHPNVVRVLDYEFHLGIPCLVMELVDGVDLKEYFKEKKHLGPEAVYILVNQISKALKAAHDLNIVHRDLKPSNILLAGDPTRGLLVKVADFGVAKTIKTSSDETQLTMQGKVIGTPAYMSPEQVQGESVDTRSDIYSLAVLTFELLTGINPFHDPNFTQSMMKHLHSAVPSLTKLAPDFPTNRSLDRVLQKAMAKKREHRIAKVEDFASMLKDSIIKKRKRRITARLESSHVKNIRLSMKIALFKKRAKKAFTENLGLKMYCLVLVVPVVFLLKRQLDSNAITRGLEQLSALVGKFF